MCDLIARLCPVLGPESVDFIFASMKVDDFKAVSIHPALDQWHTENLPSFITGTHAPDVALWANWYSPCRVAVATKVNMWTNRTSYLSVLSFYENPSFEKKDARPLKGHCLCVHSTNRNEVV